ncbi:MAG: GGDEF domain-containing protein [Halanaerobiales bacterium]|nr:GGDEF domain-containing protein [Halanaerobiales bacterium]
MESEKELKYISFHDTMTGLYNRNYLNQLLTNKFENEITIIFMFDIDKLKYVNDNFGHVEGDRLIKSFADVLKQCFRKKDIVARIGGDEFTAFLYDGDEKTAKSVQKRIINLINMYNENLKDEHLKLSVSMGYVINQSNNDTIEDLMKKADALMYKDKMGKS